LLITFLQNNDAGIGVSPACIQRSPALLANLADGSLGVFGLHSPGIEITEVHMTEKRFTVEHSPSANPASFGAGTAVAHEAPQSKGVAKAESVGRQRSGGSEFPLDKYNDLMEAAPDAMVIVNQGGEIVLLNLQAENSLGTGAMNCSGRR
jgi:PAS domain-containing protein